MEADAGVGRGPGGPPHIAASLVRRYGALGALHVPGLKPEAQQVLNSSPEVADEGFEVAPHGSIIVSASAAASAGFDPLALTGMNDSRV